MWNHPFLRCTVRKHDAQSSSGHRRPSVACYFRPDINRVGRLSNRCYAIRNARIVHRAVHCQLALFIFRHTNADH
ncbi:hypothetical protein BBM0476_09605 [Bifidobacterium breve MCC 0476]|nr:hypothetical protein BBM0476_09605 [Bifidobacterium breve MCC 0476]